MLVPFLKKLPSRLVLRIYLVGLLQFAVVVAGMEAYRRQSGHRFQAFLEDQERFLLDGLAAKLDDRAGLAQEVARIERGFHWSIAVRDGSGEVLAQTADRVGRPEGAEVDDGDGLQRPRERTVVLPGAEGRSARVTYLVGPPPPMPGPGALIALVVVVVGIASWLTARSLARPLVKLSQVATAFGQGQLDARVAADRADELGDVGRAFDQMAQRLTKLLRAEKELLANVSHELRTPLARIHVALDLASEGDAEMARESLQEINEDLAELERIVDDVLMAARLSLREDTPGASTGPQLRAQPVDVTALLRKSIARFRSAHPERPIEADLPADLPLLSADPVLLRRVVDNLLENAHKYTDEPHRPIELAAAQAGAAVTIVVRDHGMGIARGDLERVFEPFFRADRSRTRATGGLGLGLALARGIVVAHGGTLQIESELGRGTSARIVIPVAPDASAAPDPKQEQEQEQEPTSGRG